MALSDDVQNFIFGGNTGLTYEALKRRQAVAAAVASQKRPFPKTFGEGLTALGEAVGDRLQENRLAEAEREMVANGQTTLKGPPAATTGVATPPTAAPAAAPPAVAPPAAGANTFQGTPFTTITPARPGGAPPPAAAPPIDPTLPNPAVKGYLSESSLGDDRRAGVTNALVNSATPGVAQENPTLGAAILPPDLSADPGSQGSSESASDDIVTRRQNAIAGIETGGRRDPYTTIGVPTTYRDGTVDRPYGRYQVMGRNIPEWTQAALGRALTPAEFLASPEAQNAVFNHRFGSYVEKYGEEGAARAWFGGPRGMNNLDGKDVLGTSLRDYGASYLRRLGAGGAEAAAPGTRATALASLTTGVTDAPPPGLIPSLPIDNPPIETNIPAATQVAQAGPGMIPGATVTPDMFSPTPTRTRAPASPGTPQQPRSAPIQYPDYAGPQPLPPGPTPDMTYWRNAANNPRLPDDVRAEAASRYKELFTAQHEDFVRRYKLWEERANPEKQLDIAKKQLEVDQGRRPYTQTVDGRLMQWDQATGKWSDVTPQPPGTEGGPPVMKLTEDQGKTLEHHTKAQIALEQLQRIPNAEQILAQGLRDELAGKLPFFGNTALSAKYREVRNAMENFIQAHLRRTSGAAIGAEEMATHYRNLVPIYGDDPATIRNKAEQRAGIVNGMYLSLGQARPLADYATKKRAETFAAEERKRSEVVNVSSEAEAQKLPPGTRFNLNGRTGTVK